jgi:hypothetical protein
MGFRNSFLCKLLLTFVFVSAIVVSDIFSRPGYVIYEQYNDSIKKDSLNKDTLVYKESMIDSAIAFGKTFLGLKYRYGGGTEAGFDCSGYVSYLFSKFGYELPHSSAGMGTVGYPIDIKEARKGDLILFKGRSTKSSRVGHVALIIAADSGNITMMHSCHRGVLIEKYNNSAYYKARYLMCRRYNL